MTADTTYTAHQITATSAELPIAMTMARQHLRNEEETYDDAYLQALIKSCGAAVEKQYGIALLHQTVKQYHNAFPLKSDTPILLRIAPLVSVTSIEYVDADGVTSTWDSDEYASGHYNNTAFIVPKIGYGWPTGIARLPNAVTITYQAGFGSKASALPGDIRAALLLTLAHFYENREDAPATLPTAAGNLLMPYYRFSC